MDSYLEGMGMKNDDYLTPEESEKLLQAFQAFDRDENGYIDEHELKNVLESIFIIYVSDGTESNRRRRSWNDDGSVTKR